jgi:hypothetical protein
MRNAKQQIVPTSSVSENDVLPSQSFQLLSLARELRDRIYEYMILDPEADDISDASTHAQQCHSPFQPPG